MAQDDKEMACYGLVRLVSEIQVYFVHRGKQKLEHTMLVLQQIKLFYKKR